MRLAIASLAQRLALGVALALGAAGGWAQAPAPRESSVKAAFLYKFASFIEWPAGVFQRPEQPLVIGVAGDEDVAAELEQLVAGRTIEGRPAVVRRVAESAAGVHVLFIGRRRDRLQEMIAAVPGPVLIVTEQPGALQAGSVINFSTDGQRVRFSASLTSAEARNIRLSARLLAVAQVIEGRR